MAAFPMSRKSDSRDAILRACRTLESEGRPITLAALAGMVGMKPNSVGVAIKRLQSIGKFPHRAEDRRNWRKGAPPAYLKVVAAAEQIEREGGALTWDRIGRVAGCTAKAAHGHAQKAKAPGLWRFTVVPKYSLMTKEERSELWMSTRRPRGAAWTSEEDVQPMDLAILAEIRASKVEAAKEVEVRVCKYHSPHRAHYT